METLIKVFIPAILLLNASPVRAQVLKATEYEVKAAYLYNFAKFVEWPTDAFQNSDSTLVVGLLGKDPFGPTLDNLLSGKSIQERKIVLRQVNSVEEAKNCHVLFISSSEDRDLGEILKALEGRPVLMVSDIQGFVQRGGMIGFTMEQRKVRFSINKEASDAANLKVSSQLLKLAQVVDSVNNEGGK